MNHSDRTMVWLIEWIDVVRIVEGINVWMTERMPNTGVEATKATYPMARNSTREPTIDTWKLGLDLRGEAKSYDQESDHVFVCNMEKTLFVVRNFLFKPGLWSTRVLTVNILTSDVSDVDDSTS